MAGKLDIGKHLSFSIAFYWRFFVGFLFLSWVVNLFFMFITMLVGLADYARPAIFTSGLQLALIGAVTFGALKIMLGVPLKTFTPILLDTKSGDEIDPTPAAVLPVWISVLWKIIVGFLVVDGLIFFVLLANIDARGNIINPALASPLVSVLLKLILLFPVVSLALLTQRTARQTKIDLVDNAD